MGGQGGEIQRRRRSLGAAVASFVIVASVVVLATQADGREATLAESNDGGAWLVDRGSGGIAHVEYTTREPTAHTQVAESGSDITVEQSPGVIAVHDSTTSAVTLIDGANAVQQATVAVPLGATVRSRPGGLAIADPPTSRLWLLSAQQATATPDIAAAPPALTATDEVELLTGPRGEVALLSATAVIWPPEEAGAEPTTVELPDGFAPQLSTMAGGQVVLVAGGTWLAVTPDGVREVPVSDPPAVGAIQQEGESWHVVAAVGDNGQQYLIDLNSGTVTPKPHPELGSPAGKPILHDRCIYSLTRDSSETTFGATCTDGRPQTVERLGDLNKDARLRLVNGEVWIDALDGSGWVVSPEMELQEIGDFSDIFDNDDGEESADGENVEERVDQTSQDASLTTADDLDDDEENEPPIAQDDFAATRAGRPVVVDVLSNDSDPDGDVILVTSVELVSGEAEVEVPTSANAVQVTPTAGAGLVTLRYQISDGHPGGTAEATVTVDVLPAAQENNRPPEPLLDRATGATGSVVSLNVLDNDEDPDGDSIVLRELSEVEGISVLSTHPGGRVLLALPTTVSSGTVQMPYIVEDEWGEQAEGTLEVSIRLDDANTPPDARNDAVSTQVGRRVTINLLANDVDADNDPLTIGQPATPVGDDLPDLVTTTEEGEFSFQPSEPGTYLFSYSATDRTEADAALIRVEVAAKVENRPPIAVRDDITLALGETRLVPALENDGDPDGDLFAVVEATDNPNLTVVEVKGIGFFVTMSPDASRVETFSYRLSDGQAESDLATVVVTRSEVGFSDAAPVAQDDVARVRAGRTSRIVVTLNDFDPEGGPLTVTEATATDDVDVAPTSDGQGVQVSVAEGTQLPFGVLYTVVDETGNMATARVEVAIVPPDEENSAPIARSDRGYTLEGDPVRIPVLLNDSDPESDQIELVSVPEQPSGGTAELDEATGFVRYTPNPGFVGTDQFGYLVADSEGKEATGYVSVGVMPQPQTNSDPIAVDDNYRFGAGAGEVRLRVLDNDSDPDGDEITVTGTQGGDATVAASGKSVTFSIPNSLEEETQLGFTYQIADGRGGAAEARVLVTVEANLEPIPPIANPDVTAPVRAGDEVRIDPRLNDEDPDGDPLTMAVSSADATVAGNQLVITAPEETADFAYTVTDASGLTASSFVTVVVEPNLPPEVRTPVDLGEFFVDEDIPVVDLSSYVTDPDGDDLVFQSVSAQTGGTTRLDLGTTDARIVTFIPNPDFEGQGGFSYNVDDGNGHVVSGRVTLTLLGRSNDPPTATNLQLTLEAGAAPTPINLQTVFTDPDEGDELTFELVSQPDAPVEVERSGDALQLSAPLDAEASQTTFEIQATDSEGETATSTVSVSVTAANIDPPQANPDSGETNQEEPVTVNVLANDNNFWPEGDLTIINAFSANGSADISGGNITFTPATGFFGDATVEYTIADDRGNADGEAKGVLSVSVTGRPSAPTGVTGAAQGPTSVTLSWNAPAANGAPISGYEIEINGGRTVTTGASPGFTISDLTPGEAYTFRVRAINAAGEGEWSSASAPPITPDEVPGPPGKPTITFGDGQLQVVWTAGPNEGSAISEYELEVGQCASQTKAGIQGTSHTWTGLTNGTRCSFRAVAVNKAGPSIPSPWSDPECPVGPPPAPGQPSAERGDKQAIISWNQPANPDCEGLIGYEVSTSPGGTAGVPAGTLQTVAAPLTNGNTYQFQVRAQNRAGWSDFGPLSAPVTPCGVPLAPPAPTATRGDTQVGLAWSRNDAAISNGCAISQYEVNPGGNSGTISPGGNVTGLTNGTEYSFRIRGINEIGPGEWSPASNAVTPAGPPFAISSIALSSAADAQRSWQFSAPNDNGAPITNYQSTGSVSGAVSGGTSLTLACRVSGAICLGTGGSGSPAPPTACRQQAATVTAEVWAVNDVGPGDRRSGSAQLSGCPGAPSLSLSAGNGKFSATWSRPSGTDRSYVEVGGDYGGAVSGTRKTFSATNWTTYSVRAWACNEFGCAASAVKTVTPESPRSISISWGGLSASQNGCNPSYACKVINYSFSGFPPNRNLRLACGNDTGIWKSGTINTGSGSGSGDTSSICWIQPGYNGKAYLTLDGVASNSIGP